MKLIKNVLSFILFGIILNIIFAGFRFLAFTFLKLLKVLWIALKLSFKTAFWSIYYLSRVIAWPFKNCFPAKSIDQMSGLEFEEFCSKWLALEGYRSIQCTPSSSDYGVDILTIKNQQKFGIQCKRYSGNVGVGAVQEISAGLPYYECERGIVMTNSKFTKNAIDLALANDVLLIDGEMINKSKSCKALTRNRTAMFFSVIIMAGFSLASLWALIWSLFCFKSIIPLTLMLFSICSLTLLNGIIELKNRHNQHEDISENEIIDEEFLTE